MSYAGNSSEGFIITSEMIDRAKRRGEEMEARLIGAPVLLGRALRDARSMVELDSDGEFEGGAARIIELLDKCLEELGDLNEQNA